MRLAGHEIEDPDRLVRWYADHVAWGPTYYRYQPRTDPDLVTIEDLGAATLLAGQPRGRAAYRLATDPVDISGVTRRPLHETTPAEREGIVDAIVTLVGSRGSGIAASVATKVLHKKRPATVPILDNAAIYATFLSATWRPGVLPRGSSRRSRVAINQGLAAVHAAVTDVDNLLEWKTLESAYPDLERIESFDMIWWAFVRRSATR